MTALHGDFVKRDGSTSDTYHPVDCRCGECPSRTSMPDATSGLSISPDGAGTTRAGGGPVPASGSTLLYRDRYERVRNRRREATVQFRQREMDMLREEGRIIEEWRADGARMADIGAALGLSRQRVGQLVAKYAQLQSAKADH